MSFNNAIAFAQRKESINKTDRYDEHFYREILIAAKINGREIQLFGTRGEGWGERKCAEEISSAYTNALYTIAIHNICAIERLQEESTLRARTGDL